MTDRTRHEIDLIDSSNKSKNYDKQKIKKELISIIADYKQTMSKDLEQALENLHDEIESDKEDE